MYSEFLDALLQEILDNSVLTASNAIFKIKSVWINPSEDQKNIKVESLRFSNEIALMVEIIQQELNKLKDTSQNGGKSKQKAGESHEDLVAIKIFGLIFNKMIKKIKRDTDTLMLYLYPYLRESKK